MIKIWVTHLDQLKRYQDGKMERDELIRVLKGEAKSPFKANFGTAFHQIIEDPIRGSDEKGWKVNDIRIKKHLGIPAIRYRSTVPGATHEEWCWEIVDTPAGKLAISGKMDVVWLNEIHDHKVTERPQFNYYYDSYQWRTYLMLMNANIFQYNIFHIDSFEKPNRIEHIPYRLYGYPEMRTDVLNQCAYMLEFIRMYNLEKYLWKEYRKN